MSDIIQPRVLKGFRDILPEAEIERADMMERLTGTFRSYGFVPIDTPVLEYAEILLGKAGGETEKQVYRFKDNGGRDVAMRFDLTVPFARFMAEHLAELYLPFKRYHLAKVWRGENTQRGRYREFVQCDFDIVGSDSAAADFEILSIMRSAMRALGVSDTTIHMNNRAIFNRFLDRLGLGEKSVDILRIVDKLAKIGADDTRAQLAALAGGEAAGQLMDYIRSDEGFDATLARITALAGGPGPDTERLQAIRAMAEACGIAGSIVLSPNITRGLDYYTGIVFETFLNELPEIGSVCSGGRYNDLASLYTKQKLPGVGASVGMDRLLAGIEALGRNARRGGYTKLIILNLESSLEPEYQAAAAVLREAGISAELFLDQRKLGQQYGYAEKKGIPYGLIRGAEEQARGVWLLRDMATRENSEYGSMEALAAALKLALSGRP
jgi:histidyl-tRNA synthetase